MFTNEKRITMKTKYITLRIDSKEKKQMIKEAKALNFDTVSQLIRWLFRNYITYKTKR